MSRIQFVSKILAIRLARLGDLTLLLPSLRLLKSSFPNATLTVLTGLPYEPLARLCPVVDDVIPIDRLGMRDGPRWRAVCDIVRLVRILRSRHFDLVVDFQGFRETNLMARASGGRYRIGLKRTHGTCLPFCFNLEPAVQDERTHVAELFRQVVRKIPGLENADAAPGGLIRVSGRCGSSAHPVVALYVGASAEPRRWPAERFGAIAAHAVRTWGASVLVLSGLSSQEQATAEKVAEFADCGSRIRVFRHLDIPGMVDLLAIADLFVSNDSGPMHIGSALGVPTLGIFSESPPHHYSPIGAQDRYVHRECATDVESAAVVEILEEMWATSPVRRHGS